MNMLTDQGENQEGESRWQKYGDAFLRFLLDFEDEPTTESVEAIEAFRHWQSRFPFFSQATRELLELFSSQRNAWNEKFQDTTGEAVDVRFERDDSERDRIRLKITRGNSAYSPLALYLVRPVPEPEPIRLPTNPAVRVPVGLPGSADRREAWIKSALIAHKIDTSGSRFTLQLYSPHPFLIAQNVIGEYDQDAQLLLTPTDQKELLRLEINETPPKDIQEHFAVCTLFSTRIEREYPSERKTYLSLRAVSHLEMRSILERDDFLLWLECTSVASLPIRQDGEDPYFVAPDIRQLSRDGAFVLVCADS